MTGARCYTPSRRAAEAKRGRSRAVASADTAERAFVVAAILPDLQRHFHRSGSISDEPPDILTIARVS